MSATADRVLRVEDEAGQGSRGAVDEELDGGAGEQLRRSGGCRRKTGSGSIEYWTSPRCGEGFAAGGQDAHAWARLAAGCSASSGAGIDEVLAVVEDQQDGPVAQMSEELVLRRRRRDVPDVERCQDGARDLVRVGDTGQAGEADAVGEEVARCRGPPPGPGSSFPRRRDR